MELLRSIGYYVPCLSWAAMDAGGLWGSILASPACRHRHSSISNKLRLSSVSPRTRTAGAGGSSRVFSACSAGLQESAAGQVVVPVRGPKVASATASDANSSGDHQYNHGKNQGGGGGVIGGHETPGFWNSSMLGNGSSNGGGDSW
uniref:Uncharacterized protein n=1 Tax=Oryza barthii TaxID=65489 RepID=A0A0D3HCY4_9ORYZ